MLSKIKKLMAEMLKSPKYEPGTVLIYNPEYNNSGKKIIVLYHIYKKAPNYVNNIVCTSYPITDLDYSGPYSYTSLRKYFNTCGFDKTVATLYGKK